MLMLLAVKALWAWAKVNWKLAGIMLVVVGLYTAWQVDRVRQFNAGRQAAIAESVKRANDLIEKRKQDDKELESYDAAAWCREFGYRLQPDGTCGSGRGLQGAEAQGADRGLPPQERPAVPRGRGWQQPDLCARAGLREEAEVGGRRWRWIQP